MQEFDGKVALVTGGSAETTLAEWTQVLAVNLTGAFLTVKYALPFLRQRGHSSIVMVSSVQAYVTQTAVAAYTASKGALNARRFSDDTDAGVGLAVDGLLAAAAVVLPQ